MKKKLHSVKLGIVQDFEKEWNYSSAGDIYDEVDRGLKQMESNASPKFGKITSKYKSSDVVTKLYDEVVSLWAKTEKNFETLGIPPDPKMLNEYKAIKDGILKVKQNVEGYIYDHLALENDIKKLLGQL